MMFQKRMLAYWSALFLVFTMFAGGALAQKRACGSGRFEFGCWRDNRTSYVFVTSICRNRASLWANGTLYRNVRIINYNRNYEYGGVMMCTNFDPRRIRLYNAVPMDQTIALVDESAIKVNGVEKPLAEKVHCYTTVDGFAETNLQPANNKDGLDYTAAAVYYNEEGQVAELYYTYDPDTFPKSDTEDVDWLGNADLYGILGLNGFGLVTLEAMAGVYDAHLNKIDYLVDDVQIEVVFEMLPALTPFIYGDITLDGSKNTYHPGGAKFRRLCLNTKGSNTSSLLAKNNSEIRVIKADILSSSDLDSDLIGNELNTYTEADEYSGMSIFSDSPDNVSYFNVKTDELGSQWGINAVVYAINGGKIRIGDNWGERSTITATGDTANLAWACTVGSEIFIQNTDLIGYSGANHGTDVTYGGHITVDNVFIETFDRTSTALTTDFGGGTVNAVNVTAITHSAGSAGSYVEGGGWVTADNSGMQDHVFQTSQEAMTAMDGLQAAVDEANGSPVAEAYRNRNLIWSISDAAAVVSHHGRVNYKGLNAAGPYGILIMNSGSWDGSFTIVNSSITAYGSSYKTNREGDAISTIVGVFGGMGTATIDNTLVTVNDEESSKNYLVYAMTNSFMDFNNDADGQVNFINCNGAKTLKGDIGAEVGYYETNNALDIYFVNSAWEGHVTGEGGLVDISLDASSIWKVTEDAHLNRLSVANINTISADTAVTVYYKESNDVVDGTIIGNVTFVQGN